MVHIKTKKRAYCHKCKKHRMMKVAIYKKGKENKINQGKRRYDKKQAGFGGQTKPVQHNKAKTTKKITLGLTCPVTKAKTILCYKRAKSVEITDQVKQSNQPVF